MGGIGSGNKSGMGTTTTEEHKRIDIRYLKQLGVLGNYCSGTLSWSCNGHQSGFIDYSSSPSTLILKYRFRWNGGDWQPVTQHVRFVETPCSGSSDWSHEHSRFQQHVGHHHCRCESELSKACYVCVHKCESCLNRLWAFASLRSRSYRGCGRFMR